MKADSTVYVSLENSAGFLFLFKNLYLIFPVEAVMIVSPLLPFFLCVCFVCIPENKSYLGDGIDCDITK